MTYHGDAEDDGEFGALSESLFRPLLPPWVAVAEMDPALADPGALDPLEYAQVDRAVDKRRREYAAGRILTRRLLRARALADAPLLNGADRAPQWPDGVVGSITHCLDCCAVALASTSQLDGLGIDVEPAQPLPVGVAAHVVSAAERACFSSLPAALVAHADRLIFSAKEAAYKALYPRTRRFLDFPELQVLLDARGGFAVTPTNAACGFTGSFSGGYRLHAGHLATAVVLRPGALAYTAD